jgi:transcriptional regulator with XRE-family HTH domain
MGRQKVGLHPVARDALRILGQDVRIARVQKGWTGSELAHAAGVSPATVSKIENGEAAVSVGNVLNIAAIAGVRLFSYDDPTDLALRRRRGEELIGLLPARVRAAPARSDDGLDF